MPCGFFGPHVIIIMFSQVYNLQMLELLLSVRWSLLQGLPVEAGLQVRCAHTLQLLLLHPRSGDLEAVVGTLDQVFPDTLALS